MAKARKRATRKKATRKRRASRKPATRKRKGRAVAAQKSEQTWKPPSTDVQAPEDTARGRTLEIISSPADDLPPETLITLLRTAQRGDIADAAKLMHAMEQRDPVIGGHMHTRRSGVLACGYEIVPDDEADDETAAQEAAELVKEHVRRLDTRAETDQADEGIRFRPNWKGTLSNALDAIGKEFSVQEFAWDTRGGQWQVDHIEWRPQWWFRFEGDELRLRDGTAEGQRLPPANFYVHRSHALCGIPGTTALLLQLTRAYVASNYALKDILALAEVFGQPFRIGYYTDNMSDLQKDELWYALYRLGTDACALIREGSQIEFKETKAANIGTIHERLLKQTERWKTLGILGQIGQVTEGGSYAKQAALDLIRFDLLDTDAEQLEVSVRQQVFAPLTHYNLGDVPVPKLLIPRQAPVDLKATIEAYREGASLGMRIPVAWAHEQTGIPMADDDEPALTPPAAPSTPFNAASVAAAAAVGAELKKKDPASPARSERFVC